MRTWKVQHLVWFVVGLLILFVTFSVAYAVDGVLKLPEDGGQAARGLASDIALSWFGIVGLIVLIAYWVPAYALTPLRTATEKVRSMGEGALDERVPPEGLAEFRDLATSLNAMARALSEREQRLLHQERLTAIDVLLAGVAHEINNPLTFLRLNEDMVLRDARQRLAAASAEDVEQVQRVVVALERNVDGLRRLQEITAILREISPKNNVEPSPHDVNRIVEGVVVLLQHRAMYGITVDLELRATSAVDALGFDLSHVLLVVLTNAADAVDGTGRVTVRTRDEGGFVVVEVDDSGPGISEALIDRLFEPHVTTKPNAAGLGLASARSLIQEMGGSITGENLPGGGARFSLRLPAATG